MRTALLLGGVAVVVLAVATGLLPHDAAPSEPTGAPRGAGTPTAAATPTSTPTPDDGVRTGGAEVGQPTGYARGTTGGAAGATVWVTSLDDAGPGTLRAALAVPGATWIRFAVPGRIVLESPLQVLSDTTIDGRDERIEITATADVTALQLTDVHNVILHALVLTGDPDPTDDRGEPRADAINVLRSHDVWIDHMSLTGWGDKLIGVPASTGLTISYNHLHDQDECMLVGTLSSAEESMANRVTIHHNLFDGCNARSPRAGDGSQVHFYNNVVRHWSRYGVAAVRGAQVLSHDNVFVAKDGAPRALLADSGRGGPGFVRSVCDLELGTVRIRQRRPEVVFDPQYESVAHEAGAALVAHLERWAGHQPSLTRDAAPDLTAPTSDCMTAS